MIKSIQEIKFDYQNILKSLDSLIDSVVCDYRNEVCLDLGEVSAYVYPNENGPKFHIGVTNIFADKKYYNSIGSEYSYAKHGRNRPTEVNSLALKTLVESELRDTISFIEEFIPDFSYYRNYYHMDSEGNYLG